MQLPSVAGSEPDRIVLFSIGLNVNVTQAVPVSRDTTEPVSSGSPPDDRLGESRPVKPDGDDTLADGSARDSTTGHSGPSQGPCRSRLGTQRPETSPASGRVPVEQEAPSFTAGEDVTTACHRTTEEPVYC